ncbi:hypothetical protein ACIRNI_22825 [Streptomyces sp. NPDC093546]|uniref:hypothetical protein n=1 Tax=Streptomyces sp. NPDC093546 TaxID=3366040 RepID=UPI00381B8E03
MNHQTTWEKPPPTHNALQMPAQAPPVDRTRVTPQAETATSGVEANILPLPILAGVLGSLF